MMSNTTAEYKLGGSGGNHIRLPAAARRWLAFLLGLLLVWVFMFVVGPALRDLPSIKPMADFVEERDIPVGARFYTEIEESGPSELNMRSTMDYSR